MACARVIDAKDEEGMDAEDERRFQNPSQSGSCNWKMSYNVIDAGQRNIMFQRESSFVFYTYRGQLQNACPGDIKLLKEHTSRVKEEITRMKINDAGEEYETQLDRTDSMLEPPKLRVWDEYKKLLESAQPTKRELDFQSLLTEITCLQKVPVDRYSFEIC
ncbi:uncharacterized protein LOC143174695 [Nomia melanderi]|uniref:uncharacterized protein LOC143174695 n=1 Tax=Nomia melanderi TaxID=2448451 RepID=UPI003FCDEDC9